MQKGHQRTNLVKLTLIFNDGAPFNEFNEFRAGSTATSCRITAPQTRSTIEFA